MPSERPDRTQGSIVRIAEIRYELALVRMRLEKRGVVTTDEEWLTAVLRSVSGFQDKRRLGVQPFCEVDDG